MKTVLTMRRKTRRGYEVMLPITPLEAQRQIAAACFTEATQVATRTTSTIASKKTLRKADS